MADAASLDAGESGRLDLTFWLAGFLGLALTVVTVTIVLGSAGPGDRPLMAAGRALVIAVPVGIGLWLWRYRRDRRVGQLLVAAGCIWFLPTLAESGNDVVYSLGRVGAWLVEPVLLFVILSVPSGRLTGRLERAVVAAAVLLVLVLYLPTALLVERYPEPFPYGSCGFDCPTNAFMLPAEQPVFVDDVVRPVRDVIAIALYAIVLVILVRRYRASTRLLRLTLAPVIAVGLVRAATFVIYVLLRQADPTSTALDAIAWVYQLTLPGIALAILVGLLRSRLYAGEALQRLAVRLRQHTAPDEITVALRETMEDPSLELAFRIDDGPLGWVDAAGRPVPEPPYGSGRMLTEVRGEEGRAVAVVHDTALHDQEEFVEAAGSLALGSLENQLLTAKVEASLRELSDSRARIQAAADNERRRIERDLHDGAQQRLVALRIRLGLAGELMREDPARASELVRELGAEAEEALEEVRSLAHGVYPSLLADQGLPEALRALARDGSLVSRVEVESVGRYAPEIESAVYFCCLEALQNATKHAAGVTSVTISIAQDEELRFAVVDDGAGFEQEEVRPGAGLTNMRDRLAAVGGELAIGSEPGAGTRVTGRIPSSALG
ncbi:MAG: sensor histidine kinase [Gaiellaceae bacterium]